MNRVCLVILDGWGYSTPWGGNPISVANPQTFNMLWRTYPKTLLQASGNYVGLPGHEAGNSEVGHLNIGAGRIVKLDQAVITEKINDGSFFENQILIQAFNLAKHNNGAVHLMGLVSAGGVHSYLDHIFALLELASQQKFDHVYIHMFSDGRDSPPQSALETVSKLQEVIDRYNLGQIATVSGRFFAMDRDHHYDRVQKAIDAMIKADGPQFISARQALASSYKQGLSDEYVVPSVITHHSGQPVAKISEKDSVIFFNFRADRARQITDMFLEQIPGIHMVTFVPYGFQKELGLNLKNAFKPEPINHPLTQIIADVGVKQFHIAETEKYAHVTYFFNGGIEEPFAGEERLLVASPKVISFDTKPEMSAAEITLQTIRRISDHRYGFLVINFANADMVGHTGNIQAAMKAIWSIDEGLRSIYESCQKANVHLIVTSDHGNVEQMLNVVTKEPDTEHSANPIPFILVPPPSPTNKITLRSQGVLADIAPTILQIMGIKKPLEMTGTDLQKELDG